MGLDQHQQDYLQTAGKLFSDMLKTCQTANPMFNPDKMAQLLNSGSQIDTEKLLQGQLNLMQQQLQLWQKTTRAMLEQSEPENVVENDRSDKRFKDRAWKNDPVFSYLKQSYLLNARLLEETVDSIHFDDEKTRDQAKFFTRQFISSMSPTNTPLTNPEVHRKIQESQGQSLMQGFENYLHDLQKSPMDSFKITQTPEDAFVLGKDLANTPGQVVAQTDLMQLIQYTPTTDKVQEAPLLIIPPFINKYYIMDLGARKSMVRWLVEQGHTVFMISWVNPTRELSHKRLDDYMLEGPVAALDAIESITGRKKINVAGYCVGGTLLACTAAYLKAIGDDRINSLTFFATMLDFSEPGEIGNFVSEEMVELLRQETELKGVLDGRKIGLGFNMLRENSLFWSYFVDNYLKGKRPAALDMLFWNGDATNIPAAAYNFYLRNAYLENRIKQPGGISLNGVPIDLSAPSVPTYVVASEADHIVLWESAYRSAQLLSGPTRFILASSGHIAGIINPADPGKYPHRVPAADSEGQPLPEKPEQWLDSSEKVSGSWWNDWVQWLQPQSGKAVKAREVGTSKEYPALEAAPGSYVKVNI